MKTLTEELRGYHFNKRLLVKQENGNETPSARLYLFSRGPEEQKLTLYSTQTNWESERYIEAKFIYVPASHGLFRVREERLQWPSGRVAAGDEGIMMEPWGLVYLTPEQPNDFLRVAAASPRMPLDFIYHWPEAFDPKTGAASLLPDGSVVNPLARPITLDRGWASSTPITLQPGETGVEGSGMDMDLRESRKRRTTDRLVDVGDGQNFEFQQESTFVCLNPLEVEPLPPTEDELFVRLRNPSGEAASLFVRDMRSNSDKNLPLEIKNRGVEKIVRLPGECRKAPGTDRHIRNFGSEALDQGYKFPHRASLY